MPYDRVMFCSFSRPNFAIPNLEVHTERVRYRKAPISTLIIRHILAAVHRLRDDMRWLHHYCDEFTSCLSKYDAGSVLNLFSAQSQLVKHTDEESIQLQNNIFIVIGRLGYFCLSEALLALDFNSTAEVRQGGTSVLQ